MIIEQIRKNRPKIAVVGDLMIDHYIWGDCERVSPEAPVQVVSTSSESMMLGGAGNVLNNLVSLDAEVSIFSVIGDDDSASQMMEMLADIPLRSIKVIRQEDRVTTRKSRILAANQQIVRYDRETKKPISKQSEREIFNLLESEIDDFDILLLSDYDKGVLGDTLTKELIRLAKRAGKSILIDPKGSDFTKYKSATLLTPNKKEAMLATETKDLGIDSLKAMGEKLKKELDLDAMVVTLSEDGMALFEDEMSIIPTVAREVYDVTGAGDTVLASLGVAMACGADLAQACEFANKAAAVVLAKVGSATVTLNEVEEYEHILNKGQAESKIKHFDQIKRIIKRLKEQGRRVVFTNGCFDILHRGHASYLEKTKALGDVLVVGVNSDESVSRLKGERRPINTLENRMFLLGSLESVDYVVAFAEETPIDLIKIVQPDTLVKGADYEGKEIVGSDVAAEVVLIDFIEGHSTTRMIEKIKKTKSY